MAVTVLLTILIIKMTAMGITTDMTVMMMVAVVTEALLLKLINAVVISMMLMITQCDDEDSDGADYDDGADA